jgi:hypothetical protein
MAQDNRPRWMKDNEAAARQVQETRDTNRASSNLPVWVADELSERARQAQQ